MKKTVAFIGIFLLVLLITGCGKKDLEGVWKLTGSNCNDEFSSQNIKIDMDNNEKGIMYKDEGEIVCEITVKDDKFICTTSNEVIEYDYEVEEYNIVLSRDSCGYKFAKNFLEE